MKRNTNIYSIYLGLSNFVMLSLLIDRDICECVCVWGGGGGEGRGREVEESAPAVRWVQNTISKTHIRTYRKSLNQRWTICGHFEVPMLVNNNEQH